MISSRAARHFCATVLALAFGLTVPCLAQVQAKPVAPPVTFAFNGYVQGRFSDVLGDNTSASTFEVKRAYVNLLAQLSPRVSATLMVSGAPTTEVKEAYGQYNFDPSCKARLGLVRIPFGYEIPLSSARLITLERSQAFNKLLADFTFERGLFTYYNPLNSRLSLQAAVVNGTPTSTPADTNDTKNIVARLGYTLLGGQVGASIYNGKGLDGTTMDREGIDVVKKTGEFTVIGEAIAGKTGTVDANGAYVTLAYQKKGSPWQPYARYDTYDPNTDQGNDTFHRTTIGTNYYVTDNTRLTAEYQTIDDETPGSTLGDGFVGFQYQVSF